MNKADMSREYSKWETLNRDILAIIFGKLNLRDLNKGASRVCTSWFLAAHNKTLWTTIDLDELYHVEEGLSFQNILNKIGKHFFDFCQTRKSLKDITNFSRTSPKNLFFSYNSFIEEEDLMFAAARMPNIEKLVLPLTCHHNKNSFQCSFSKWKNLKTLIIAHDDYLTGTFEFQAVGENCINLTNFKYLGHLETNVADQIVRYLQKIKRLSLRGSFVSTSGVLLLITNLQNLAVLNLSHCRKLNPYGHSVWTDDNLVQEATEKLDKFILCSQDCRLCNNDGRSIYVSWPKHWQDDEIHELEF